MMINKSFADRATGHCTVVIEDVEVTFTSPIDGSVFVLADEFGYWRFDDIYEDGPRYTPYHTEPYYDGYEMDILTSKKDKTISISEEFDKYHFYQLKSMGITKVTAIPFSEWLNLCK